MKILLLSVALLFFTGAQGRYFWQQDEPTEEQTIEKAIEHVVSIIPSIFESLDFQEIKKEYRIQEKWEAAKIHSEKLEKAVERYLEEVWKRLDEKLTEEFPVLRKDVLPILNEFDDKLVEHLKKFVKEAVPVGSDMVTGISKSVSHFFENLESIGEKGRDNMRAEIDSLRVKLQPYMNDLQAEYERYHKKIQDELQKDAKELKEGAEKNMEKVKQHLADKLPDTKELHKQVEAWFKEFKQYIQSLQ
ncbi:apolipoprotein A-I-like [Bufo gargarizans]|uniref:apolipoprotein A-I-like n=1 Tax=Bufo gargarizans TaxID=30331 RepID=UPI001CF44BF2|nr:apolipoprotein A-I-like [Bufo gargarizans]